MGKKSKKESISVSLDDIQGFIDIWKHFSETLNGALEQKEISKEQEEAFLEIKTKIARQQAVLASSGILGQGKLGERYPGSNFPGRFSIRR